MARFKSHVTDPSIRRRIMMERRVLRAAVKGLLEAGYLVQVSYERGYDNEHKPSVSLAEVMKYTMACDEEHLMVYDPSIMDGEMHTEHEDKPTSWIFLVYGNDGYDVISDYTTDLEPALKGADAVADKLEAQG